MPTVRAGDLPYQPYNSEVPSPQVPSTYQTERATPEDFGAGIGQAISGLGSAIGRGADVFAEGAIARQQLENQVRADDQTNKYQEAVNKILHGDPDMPGDTGFYGKRGEDAMRDYSSTYKSIADLRNTMRGQLANDRQRLSFDAETRREQSRALAQMGSHYDREFKTYGTATNAAGVRNAMGSAATGLAEGDQAAFETGLGNAMKFKLKQLELEGRGNNQESVNDALSSVREDGVKMQFQKLAETNPYKAKQFLDANTDALKPGEAHQLYQSIDAQWRKVQAQVDAGLMLAPEGWNEPPKITGGDNNDVNVRGNGSGHVVPKAERISYYRQKSAELGLNAEAVIATVNGEGLHEYLGDSGKSFGDFQLYTGGGMGNQAETAGINIRDPHTWKQQADFAMQQMVEHKGDAGWYAGQWHGAPSWAAQSFSSGSSGKWRTKEEIARGVPPGQGTAVPEITGKGLPAPGPSGTSEADRLADWEAAGGGDAPDSIENAPKPVRGVAPIPPPDPGMLPDLSVPGLSEKLANIASQPWAKDNPTRLRDAIQAARAAANASWTESQRARQLAKQEAEAISQEAEKEYLPRFAPGSDNPPTDAEILKDGRLTPEASMKLVSFSHRQEKNDPDPRLDHANTNALFKGIIAPYGDQGKVTSNEPIDQAYARGDISYQNMVRLHQQLAQQKVAGNETKNQVLNDWFHATEATVKGLHMGVSGQFEGVMDPNAGTRWFYYKQAVQGKIDEYEKAGKNPMDLFTLTDPKDPHSSVVGKMLDMPQFKAPLTTGSDQPDLTTEEGILRARKAGQIDREKAIEALTKLPGIVRRPTPPIAPAYNGP